MKSDAEKILEAIAVAAELTGTALSETAKVVMVEDLLAYETAAVLKALNRCRRELTGRLTLAAIIERVDNGLPTADEAFGMLADGWKNEAITVVVPEIAMLAAGDGAYALFKAGDKTGARMAFRDSYSRLAADVQLKGGAVKWFVCKGNDRDHQTFAVMEAVRLGRLKQDAAQQYLPSEAAEERLLLAENRVLTLEEKQKAKIKTGGLIKILSAKMAMGAANG